MSIPDLVNGIFEGFGSFFILNHCRALWKSKQARGISLLSTSFFTAWGLWNVYYYPHLDQWMSFIGGLGICAANLVWVWMIWYVRRTEVSNELP